VGKSLLNSSMISYAGYLSNSRNRPKRCSDVSASHVRYSTTPCSEKNQNCFCYNFVKFLLTLIIFACWWLKRQNHVRCTRFHLT